MKCIETYDGKELWVSDEQASKLEKVLDLANPPKRVNINGSSIAVNNIAGIYDHIDVKEKEYRKQGMYVCEYMRWHNFKETCYCRSNFRLYGEFGTAPKSKMCLEYEKTNGLLELNLDRSLKPKELKLAKNIIKTL